MTSISPCLWFDDDLEEAVAFYTSVFPDSTVGHLTHYPDRTPGAPPRVMAGEFTIAGVTFRGINGGPDHAGFSESISFSVTCADQAEVDGYWEALSKGGRESVCGWLTDRFGLSWQIVPTRLYELVSDPDPVRSSAATEAMLGMRRIVVADLEAAADAAALAAG